MVKATFFYKPLLPVTMNFFNNSLILALLCVCVHSFTWQDVVLASSINHLQRTFQVDFLQNTTSCKQIRTRCHSKLLSVLSVVISPLYNDSRNGSGFINSGVQELCFGPVA